MQYEISNPSDPYTFEADSHEVAALVIFLLGPAYGATPENDDDKLRVPIFLFGGASEWYQETFSREAHDAMEALEIEVADALDSVMLGHFEDRRRYNLALASIDDPEKRRAFIDAWQSGATSMHSSILSNGRDYAINGIGGYCHNLAQSIRESIEKEAKP